MIIINPISWPPHADKEYIMLWSTIINVTVSYYLISVSDAYISVRIPTFT